MLIDIYTLSYCPYCRKAKEFFDLKGLKYNEISLDGDEEYNFYQLQQKFDIKGEVTAPQIIINGQRIGGYSDLIELADKGKINF